MEKEVKVKLLHKRADINPSMLKAFRSAKGITGRTVAMACDVSERTYRGWEAGHRKPKFSHVLDICRCLDINARDLFTDAHKAIHKHMTELALAETIKQAILMDDGETVKMDMNEYMKLAERLNIFSDEEMFADEDELANLAHAQVNKLVP